MVVEVCVGDGVPYAGALRFRVKAPDTEISATMVPVMQSVCATYQSPDPLWDGQPVYATVDSLGGIGDYRVTFLS
jgi:hypothetical protein